MGCERLRRACAIALHTSIGIAVRKQPEIALVHLGASADLLGMRISDVTPETVEQILDAYPRLGFNQQITQLMVSQVQTKSSDSHIHLAS